MNLPFTSIVLQPGGDWLFSWNSTGAGTYRLVLAGRQVGVADDSDTTFTFFTPGFETYPPPLELVAVTDQALTELYPPYLLMQWYTTPCDYYVVGEVVDGQLTNYQSVSEQNKQWVYSYTAPGLVDQTAHDFQVIAVGNAEQTAPPIDYHIFIVTPPVFVDGSVAVTYDSPSKSVIVSQA
jgi:hypothetical protein